MTLGERFLLSLSAVPAAVASRDRAAEWTVRNALSTLERVFPGFQGLIKGKRVLDFGCGWGFQTVAMATNGAKYVLGVDPSTASIEKAWALTQSLGLADRVQFATALDSKCAGNFDIVISQNAMEHFSNPEAEILRMKSALADGGKLLITFGPPWFAPYGSHMMFFTRFPWVNLLFSEQTVMRVRCRYREDGATRYEDVQEGLNRMSVARFERILKSCGMNVLFRKNEAVKRIPAVTKLPVLRELLTNHLSVVLAAPAGDRSDHRRAPPGDAPARPR